MSRITSYNVCYTKLLRVHGQGDVLGIGSHLEREHRLVNELPGVQAADSGPDNSPALLVKEHLTDSVFRSRAKRPAARAPGELALFERV